MTHRGLRARGLAVASLLVVLVAPHAEPEPGRPGEGGGRHGLDGVRAPRSTTARSPTTASSGIDDDRGRHLGRRLIGVAVTFAVCAGLVCWPRRSTRRVAEAAEADVAGGHAPPLLSTPSARCPGCAPQCKVTARSVRLRGRRDAAGAVWAFGVLRRAHRGRGPASAGCRSGSWPGGSDRGAVRRVRPAAAARRRGAAGRGARASLSSRACGRRGTSWSRARSASAATVVLASTTPVPQLLGGLERLRVPRVLVAIAAS